jgi:hypothetical protein
MGPPAATVPVAAVGLAVAAISLSYLVARAHDHVPGGLKDLPDITHCAMHQPERAVFIGLFMPSCMLMIFSWLLALAAFESRAAPAGGGGGGSSGCGAVRTVRVAVVVGIIACGLLIMGEAVLDPEPNWTIHVLGAPRPAL